MFSGCLNRGVNYEQAAHAGQSERKEPMANG
jgi:hypothetical protein